MDLVEHLKSCIERAHRRESKLTDNLPPLPGMSGKKGRALINNVCSMEGTRYLEVGLWQGSTFRAALYENEIRAVGIDDWSEFTGPRGYFMQQLPKYVGKNTVSICDGDCFHHFFDEKFNVFFYDGEHSVLSQYRALAHFGPMMDSEFIYMVDDFKQPEVHQGTELVINDMGFEVLFQQGLGVLDRGHEDEDGWWDGFLAMVLRRP
jgi:hypothetical protein